MRSWEGGGRGFHFLRILEEEMWRACGWRDAYEGAWVGLWEGMVGGGMRIWVDGTRREGRDEGSEGLYREKMWLMRWSGPALQIGGVYGDGLGIVSRKQPSQ